MEHRFFRPAALALLAAPHRWRWVDEAVTAGRAPAVGRARWSAGHRHVHTYPELMLVLSGRLPWGVGARLHPAGPGTAFFIAAGVAHDLGYPPDAGPVEHLWISLPGRGVFFSAHVREAGRDVPARGGRAYLPPHRVPLDVGAWLDDMPPDGPWRRVRLHVALQVLVSLIVEEGYRPAPEAGGTETLHDAVVEAVCHHLRETGGRGGSLDALADLVGYSKFHLHRVFRARTGLTIHRYADRCRVARMRALEQKGWRMDRIGEALGFASPGSFSRWRSGR